MAVGKRPVGGQNHSAPIFKTCLLHRVAVGWIYGWSWGTAGGRKKAKVKTPFVWMPKEKCT